MTKPVVMVGAGGHARVLLSIIQLQRLQLLGVVDPNLIAGVEWEPGIPSLDTDDELTGYEPGQVKIVNGVGSLPRQSRRRELFETLHEMGYEFAKLTHPKAVVAESVLIGEGAQIMAGAVIQPGVHMKENTIVNSGAVIDHDCDLGAHVHVAPGAVICGGVSIGDRSHIGSGATVIQNVSIGHDVIIGAGAVVTQACPSYTIVYPARSVLVDQEESAR